MSESNADRVARIVDADRAWFQKQDWALAAAKLRDVVRTSVGEDRERARQALRDHYGNRGKATSSWARDAPKEATASDFDRNPGGVAPAAQ